VAASLDQEIACQSDRGGVITSGGGFSTTFAQPSWQTDVVTSYFDGLSDSPQAGYNSKGRAYPDISLSGVWYPIVVGGTTGHVFGTSASAPVLAAFLSLINTKRMANGSTSVGFINPTLYSYANSVSVVLLSRLVALA
jgi:tripeptidyl-peptidase-1